MIPFRVKEKSLLCVLIRFNRLNGFPLFRRDVIGRVGCTRTGVILPFVLSLIRPNKDYMNPIKCLKSDSKGGSKPVEVVSNKTLFPHTVSVSNKD